MIDDPNLFVKSKSIIGKDAEKAMYTTHQRCQHLQRSYLYLRFCTSITWIYIKHHKPLDTIYERIQTLSYHVLDDFKLNIQTAGMHAFKSYKITD